MGFVNEQSDDVVVIMVPFPCQSHLNQLLHLSCLISSYKIPTHYACFGTYVEQAKRRFNNTDKPQLSKIHFHEFPTPPIQCPVQNSNSSTKFPSHLQPSFDSSLQLRQPLMELFQEISANARKVVIIHDTLMSYAVQDFTSIPNAESYIFRPISAFASYCSVVANRSIQSDLEIYELPAGVPSREGCETPEFFKFIGLQISFSKFASGSILNSCRAIEGPYIDLLARMDISNKPMWAVGPLNVKKENDKENLEIRHQCLEWLDKQLPKSVIYISFGSITDMADEELNELAFGLEQSGQKFIWVLRDADKGNALNKGDDKRFDLPKGYEERVKHIGMVVREWAPQLEILGHPSTGGFMSHCGWNSCLESIIMGVPIASWPLHSDQPKNAFFVTEVLKIGVAIFQWENRNKLVTASTIAKVVKFLIESKEGYETRKRAEELGVVVRKAVQDGGASMLELDSFVSHIIS